MGVREGLGRGGTQRNLTLIVLITLLLRLLGSVSPEGRRTGQFGRCGASAWQLLPSCTESDDQASSWSFGSVSCSLAINSFRYSCFPVARSCPSFFAMGTNSS